MQIVMGDMNRDGEITISDVTSLVNVLLGKSEMQYITRDDFGKPVTGITLDKTSLTLGVGGTATLTATIIPSDAGELGIIWTSSDPSVVSVSSAASSSAGGYEIILESFGSEKLAVIKVVKEMTGLGLAEAKTLVESAPVSLGTYDSVTAATHQAALEEAGATVTLNAFGGGTEGEVTALVTGTATITATTVDGGYTATCTVTVSYSDTGNHEYVDMGEGQLWATCNVGADNPWDYGDYFAWGETTPKSEYTWSNYRYGDSPNSLTKYVLYDSYGTIDYKGVLLADDDAATQIWGEDWRIPTSAEWRNLLDKEKYLWNYTTDYNGTGIPGYTIKSLETENSIFLPLAGAYGVDDDGNVGLFSKDQMGIYWSSSLVSECDKAASLLLFGQYSQQINPSLRYGGLPIRPISSKTMMTGMTLDKDCLFIGKGSSAPLEIKLTPENAMSISMIWTSDNESIAIVSSDGVVTGIAYGIAHITATTIDGAYSSSCWVEVLPEKEGHLYADLGDGKMWAVMDVGADSPDEYGHYFSWGETEEKESYSWDTYSFGTQYALTKYVTDGNNGNVDNKTTLEPANDAATTRWGGNWRTPTIQEWEKLMATCSRASGTCNGTHGVWLTSTEGVKIFLPYSGVKSSTVTGAGVDGYAYRWSSSLSNLSSDYAYDMRINHNTSESVNSPRYIGIPVRAVNASIVHVTGITLNRTTMTLEKGKYSTLVATLSPEDATNTNVLWKSSNTSVATVNVYGRVTAVETGTATITATTVDGGFTATCEVTVAIPVTGISLNKTETRLTVGDTEILSATIVPNNATNKNITWSSSNTSVATVNSNGKVTAIAAGSALITAKSVDGGYSATCRVTVVAIPVTGISLNKTQIDLTVGGTETLIAIVSPENATNQTVIWNSSNNSLAEVDSNGRVSAKGSGSAIITATTVDGNYKATCSVNITARVLGVTLNKSSLTLLVGETETLIATVSPADAIQTVTWSSSDTSIVTVDSGGLVQGIKSGSARITATTYDNRFSIYCYVTVSSTGTISGHGFVMMGDGLKWATMNIGASSETDFGDYFAWGETEPKKNYSWGKYKYGTQEHLTKYVTSSDYGTVDNLTVLESSDDAATTNWGKEWRTPTFEEWVNLLKLCTTEWVSNYKETGISGRLLTSTAPGFEGNELFIPAAGYCYDTTQGYYQYGRGYYMSSSLFEKDYGEHDVKFNDLGWNYSNYSDRCDGLSVRAVAD